MTGSKRGSERERDGVRQMEKPEAREEEEEVEEDNEVEEEEEEEQTTSQRIFI